MTATQWMDKMGEWFVPEPNTGCWLWTGVINRGYGHAYIRGRTERAHRISYELLRGPIPDGLQIDHLCRCRSCVNPDHMECVTNKENVLRGYGISAINARKTHCAKGHEYTPDNTLRYRGRRYCRECNKLRNRIRHGYRGGEPA